ncbi:MAG: hypothetical protein OQL19_10000 [Gammaproteobacteria bacterium]|nr:hypothetical protein [Gammaproteobacteria bacterium]
MDVISLKINNITKLIFFVVSVFVLQGCFSTQSYPHKARAGDTISLSVGASDDMTLTNTSVLYYPTLTPNQPIDLTTEVKSIFNLYPDSTSYAWTDDSATTTHGAYSTIIIIDLPTTLAAGDGVIKIQTTASYHTQLLPNDIEIAFEVLPGVGAPNPLLYHQSGGNSVADINRLAPQPRVKVSQTQGQTQWPEYAAAEVVIFAPSREKVVYTAVSDDDLRVVSESSIKAQRPHHTVDWQRNGDTITAYLVNSTGKMRYTDIDLSILLSKDINEFHDVPSLTSIRYFDLDGNEVAGPLPTVTLLN